MILSVVNLKGGVGKTTSAAFIGHALAERGRRVTLVDADPQRSLIEWAELGAWDLEVQTWDQWHVLGEPEAGQDVIIDCPPSQHASVIVERCIRTSTHVVVPMTPAAVEFGRMSLVRTLIEDVATSGTTVAVLLVRTISNASSTEVYRQALVDDGWRVLRGVIPRRETFAQAWGGPIVRAASTGYGDAVAELRPSPVALEVQG